jgi:hypothetical protein
MIACDELKIGELKIENCSAASEIIIVYISRNVFFVWKVPFSVWKVLLTMTK